jgi:pentapeptide MXKDX repeat protein
LAVRRGAGGYEQDGMSREEIIKEEIIKNLMSREEMSRKEMIREKMTRDNMSREEMNREEWAGKTGPRRRWAGMWLEQERNGYDWWEIPEERQLFLNNQAAYWGVDRGWGEAPQYQISECRRCHPAFHTVYAGSPDWSHTNLRERHEQLFKKVMFWLSNREYITRLVSG